MIGSVSHGTMQPRDLIPTFASTLETLERGADRAPMVKQWHAELIREARALDFDDGAIPEKANAVLEELFDALDEYAPDYMYFGAHPGDGSDYGFWLQEGWQERAKEDDVLFVSDLSEVPADFPFDGLVCHVNDHGNATLYRMDYAHAGSSLSQLKEVWSVV